MEQCSIVQTGIELEVSHINTAKKNEHKYVLLHNFFILYSRILCFRRRRAGPSGEVLISIGVCVKTQTKACKNQNGFLYLFIT